MYDEHGNIIYCMPANMKQILRDNQLPSTGFVVTRSQNTVIATDGQLSESSEPIYENIPLPWDSEMRARTQSIHSAPEAVNHAVKARQEAVDDVSVLIVYFYCVVREGMVDFVLCSNFGFILFPCILLIKSVVHYYSK